MKIIRNMRDSRQVKFLEDTIKATTIEIELTDDELREAYWEARNIHYKDWMAELLEEYEYQKQTDAKLREMAETYLNILDGEIKWNRYANDLGELQHDAFKYMMDQHFKDIKEEE